MKQTEVLTIIKFLRIQNNFTQKEISDKININSSMYSLKESNRSRFKFTEILDIFKILHMDIFINKTEIVEYVDFLIILKIERKKKRITQDSMRQKLGLKSHPAFNNKENGRTIFYFTEVIQICDILDLDIEIKYMYFSNDKCIIKEIRL